MIRTTISIMAFLICVASLQAAQVPTKLAVGYATISGASVTLWAAQDEKFFIKNGIGYVNMSQAIHGDAFGPAKMSRGVAIEIGRAHV